MRIKTLSMIFLMAIAFVASAASVAFANGGDVSGGGSIREAEFKDVFRNLIFRLDGSGIWVIPGGGDVDKFNKVLDEAKISFVNKDLFVTIDGVEKHVDARNYPKTKLIEVDSRSWDPMKEEERERLVLHEFYGLLEIEKNRYEMSDATLSLLRSIESRETPEDICSMATMGSHDGDGCLMHLQDDQEDHIKALQKVLLKFGRPQASDDEETAEFKARVTKFIKTQKSSFKIAMDAQCDMQVTSEGNYGAYDRSLCEVEVTNKVLKTLRDYYNEIKARYPSLPLPAPVKPWNG